MSSVKANFQKQHHCQGKCQNSSMTIAQDKCHDTSMTLVVIRRVPASPLLVPALTSARHVPTLAAPASAESNAHNDLDSRQLVASGQLCNTSQTSTQSGRHAHIPEPRPAQANATGQVILLGQMIWLLPQGRLPQALLPQSVAYAAPHHQTEAAKGSTPHISRQLPIIAGRCR